MNADTPVEQILAKRVYDAFWRSMSAAPDGAAILRAYGDARVDAELAELRKDKARLDWLDHAGYLIRNVNQDGIWKEWNLETLDIGAGLRAAIDAAIAQRPNSP